MIGLDLDAFAAAVHAQAPEWERIAIRWQLTFGPERDKSAAWVVCEIADLAGQLIVWTSGEAELDIVDFATGAHHAVHYDLATADELTACLNDLTQRVSRRA